MGRVVRGQSLVLRVDRRVAKAAVTEVCDAGTGNKKKLQTDPVKGSYRVRAFVPGCNIVGVRPGQSLFRARLLAFLQVRE